MFVPDEHPRFAGICFDLDDTLVDRAAAFARALEVLAERHPAAFAAGAGSLLRALDNGGRGDRHALAVELVRRFPSLGSAEAFFDGLIEAIVEGVRPRPEVTALVAGLASRYRLAVVSDGGPRQREKLARAGLARWFDAGRVVISSEVGVEKPDPRIFAAALEALDLAPGEVLHVGDDPERDIVGATRAGLASCWVSHGAPYPAPLPAPSLAVRELDELPARIEGVRCTT